MRRIAVALVATAMAAVLAFYDAAEAVTCAALQAELLTLQRGANRSDRARFERAYREQASVLIRTERRARRAGCFSGGFRLFRRGGDASCRAVVAKLQAMQDNLARLDRLRRQGGRAEGNTRRARQIQRALAAGQCTPTDRRDRAREAALREAPRSRPVRGTFRTLCVRSCDGYYFPISFSTTQERFVDDAQACSAMCPGTDAKLFVHPNPGGGPEDMVSIDGQPYRDLPAAFSYRTSLTPSCTCGTAAKSAYSMIATNTGGALAAEPGEPEAKPPRIPQPRPVPGEDPETLADLAGGFVPRALPGEPTEIAAGLTAHGRAARVVGPVYWGAPQDDKVVISPVPN